MPRIAGIDIPPNKRAVVSLTYIHGVGPHTAKQICKAVNVNPDVRAKDLTETEVKAIATQIEQTCTVEGSLRRLVQGNVQRLKDIGCWRGLRHRRGMPVRGQRTRTNARTRKGKAKTVAGKKSIKSMR